MHRLTESIIDNAAIILIIAHPDDEAMFFYPTISRAKRLHIICLSNGGYDGLGEQREKELQRAARRLGATATCVNNAALQDGPHAWDPSVVAANVGPWLHAGAVVVTPDEEHGVLGTHLGADGSLGHILRVTGGISEGQVRGNPFLEMDGQAVFRLAVRALGESAQKLLAESVVTAEDIDWFVPHQANMRIINALADKIGISRERVVTTVANHGNTSAASVPLALDTAVRDGRVETGQLLMLEGVGGGMTWGSVLLRW